MPREEVRHVIGIQFIAYKELEFLDFRGTEGGEVPDCDTAR